MFWYSVEWNNSHTGKASSHHPRNRSESGSDISRGLSSCLLKEIGAVCDLIRHASVNDCKRPSPQCKLGLTWPVTTQTHLIHCHIPCFYWQEKILHGWKRSTWEKISLQIPSVKKFIFVSWFVKFPISSSRINFHEVFCRNILIADTRSLPC